MTTTRKGRTRTVPTRRTKTVPTGGMKLPDVITGISFAVLDALGAAMTIRVGRQGRMVIPSELRERLDIQPGSVLLARVTPEGRLELEDRAHAVARLRGILAADEGRSAVEELGEERQAEAKLQEAELSGDAEAIAAARAELAAVGMRHTTGAGVKR